VLQLDATGELVRHEVGGHAVDNTAGVN